jgi:hypothetical protein
MEKTAKEVARFLGTHPDIAQILELFPQMWAQYLQFIALTTPKETRSATISTERCQYRGDISRVTGSHQ